MIWANISKVFPNPKNPRSDISVNTIEMQQIIKSKGWETGITCYEQDSKYIILSGHRRWYAAKKLKIKELPVILVKAPKSEEEELKRLGSVQGGKEDWTVYEWAEHTYEMWIAWDKCSFEELAKKMRRSSRWVAERVRIFQFYPHNEIEEGFSKGTLNITVLYRLIGWLEKLSNRKPKLVASISLDMIRTTMLQKIENNLVRIADLKNESFTRDASEEQLREFLLNGKMKLSNYLLNMENSKDLAKQNASSSYQSKLKMITTCFNQLDMENITDVQETLNHLNSVKDELFKKRSEIMALI